MVINCCIQYKEYINHYTNKGTLRHLAAPSYNDQVTPGLHSLCSSTTVNELEVIVHSCARERGKFSGFECNPAVAR